MIAGVMTGKGRDVRMWLFGMKGAVSWSIWQRYRLILGSTMGCFNDNETAMANDRAMVRCRTSGFTTTRQRLAVRLREFST
jgi:hypothetical protein